MRHLAAQDRELALRHADQLGNAPYHVVLELVVLAIGIDHLPHHADDGDALFLGQRGERLGEVIEVDRLGVAPARMPPGWRLEPFADLAQMVREEPLAVVDGPDILELDERHRDDVLALVALVYPHYFRPRTMQLGRYFGIYQDGRLAAMIGERLGTRHAREMSAICTHPDFTGRGYARRLTAFLTNDTLARGRTPFLHVSYENPHAKSLYERMGYRLRRDIPFWALRRA